MSVTYEFRPMTSADLPLVKRWLVEPHVVQWWGSPDDQFDLVSGDLDEPAMDQFIVGCSGRPFAYIQSYPANAWPENGFGAQPEGARGIDQFIGESDMIERGHGSAFIRQFGDTLLASGAPRLITDPAPDNARAVRAYEKAGFDRDRLVNTPEGVSLLMVRSK